MTPQAAKMEKKRPAAARRTRHSKKYWRKGTDVADIEESISVISRQKATGGLIADMPDDDIFLVDKQPLSDVTLAKKFTKRQQAALDKITKSIGSDEFVSLPAAKAPPKRSIAKLPRGNALKKRVVKSTLAKARDFDIWNSDLKPKIALSETLPEAAQHFLEFTKKIQPKTPKKKLASILPAVSLPTGGASYNPEASAYTDYVKGIVDEEAKLIRQEQKIAAGNKPQRESIVTYKERELELTEGLPADPRYHNDDAAVGDDVEESDDDKDASEETGKPSKPMTKKQKARAAELAKEEKQRIAEKARAKDAHNVYKAKRINKELAAQEAEREKKTNEKRRLKALGRLTKRQKLGRGEFQEEEAPFLLEEELVGNLRQLKPQGSILEDRLKSMQRRNMLPIAGGRNKRILKKSLKAKYVEKRSVKEVTKGSRVI